MSPPSWAVDLAVNDFRLNDDVVKEVGQDVILNDVSAIDSFAYFGIDFGPGASDLAVQVASKWAEVFVEELVAGVVVASHRRFPSWRTIFGAHLFLDARRVAFTTTSADEAKA
jgi:hypothetical protein